MISSLPTPEQLETLSSVIETSSLPIDLPGSPAARQDRTELLDQIHDYLLPRLKKIDAPLLAVLGGSTGAGKSTITNSLVGEEVTTAGVLRPTTRAPVLVCHPDDHPWFSDPNSVLPGHARSSSSESTGTTGLRLITSESLPPGLAILDAPDIDSIEVANHDLATQLLGAADLWLFVTTAARYADAVPWEYLSTARERSTALAVVINRIPPGHEEEVAGHFSEMLATHGLGGAPVFSVTETSLTNDRLDEEISLVRNWLHDLTADSANRQSLVRSTLVGALASIPQRVQRIGDALDSQAEHLGTLNQLAVDRYEVAMSDINTELDRGTLLRGEVLEQWREFVGTGALMSKLESGVGRLRDRVKNLLRSGPSADEAAAGQLESNLLIVTRDAIDRAALDVVEQWDTHVGGKQLLADAPRGIDRAAADSGPRIERELRAWEQEVLDLVRAEAGDKVAVARTVSTGINGVGVALMVAVFSQSAGITGMEAAIATGTAAVSQTVLTAVFGEQAVRELASKARENLDTRLRHLLDADRSRFDDMTNQLNLSSQELFDALHSLEDSNREQ